MTAARSRAPEASGRFVLRLPPELHESLRHAAEDAGVSLNAYCVFRLGQPEGAATGVPAAAETIRQALDLYGRQLIGVVLIGSWARGEEADDSDVDVLIVIDASLPIRRSLYRRWDENAVTWHGRTLDPHFVHLPEPTGRITGLWAEAARDGIVLFERNLLVSRRLVSVRRRLMDGRARRSTTHGQGYWIEEPVNAES